MRNALMSLDRDYSTIDRQKKVHLLTLRAHSSRARPTPRPRSGPAAPLLHPRVQRNINSYVCSEALRPITCVANKREEAMPARAHKQGQGSRTPSTQAGSPQIRPEVLLPAALPPPAASLAYPTASRAPASRRAPRHASSSVVSSRKE